MSIQLIPEPIDTRHNAKLLPAAIATTPKLEIQTPRKRKRSPKRSTEIKMPSMNLDRTRESQSLKNNSKKYKDAGSPPYDDQAKLIADTLFCDEVWKRAKKVYCDIESVEILEDHLRKKKPVVCVERNLFNPDGYITYHSIYNLEKNDTITLEKKDGPGGNPRAYEWLLWNGDGVVLDK